MEEGGSLVLANATNDIAAVTAMHERIEDASNNTDPRSSPIPNI